jgi:hypothetical protein
LTAFFFFELFVLPFSFFDFSAGLETPEVPEVEFEFGPMDIFFTVFLFFREFSIGFAATGGSSSFSEDESESDELSSSSGLSFMDSDFRFCDVVVLSALSDG